MFVGNGIEAIHIARQAGKMGRNNGARVGGDGGFDPVAIDISGRETAIDKHGFGVRFLDHVSHREKCHRRSNHFVIRAASVRGTNAANLQCNFHRRGRRGEDAGRTPAVIDRQRLFKRLHLRPAGDLQ